MPTPRFSLLPTPRVDWVRRIRAAYQHRTSADALFPSEGRGRRGPRYAYVCRFPHDRVLLPLRAVRDRNCERGDRRQLLFLPNNVKCMSLLGEYPFSFVRGDSSMRGGYSMGGVTATGT